MNNKVLIKLIIPQLNITFDCFIPVNELIWKIKKMLIKSVSDLTNTNLNLRAEYVIYLNNNSKKTSFFNFSRQN